MDGCQNNTSYNVLQRLLTGICFRMSADVICCGVFGWVAADVRLTFPLIHSDIVDEHFRREDHGSEINVLPVVYTKYGQLWTDT